jgi:hypothetical protein
MTKHSKSLPEAKPPKAKPQPRARRQRTEPSPQPRAPRQRTEPNPQSRARRQRQTRNHERDGNNG